MQAGKWVIAGTLALGLLPAAARADYWRYETDSGSTAFTDDAKNIPAKYRASAVKIAEQSLDGYRKLSIVQKNPVVPAPRAAVTPDVAAAPPQMAYQGDETPRTNGINRLGITIDGMQVDIDADADEPVYIDKRQWVDGSGDFFDHGGVMAPTTVIRRGDKPLAYIDER